MESLEKVYKSLKKTGYYILRGVIQFLDQERLKYFILVILNSIIRKSAKKF